AEAGGGLGRLGAERDRALQVGEGLGEVPLLAEDEAEETVRVRVVRVEAQRLLERGPGRVELAALAGGEGALEGLVPGALRVGRRRGRSPRPRALLPEGDAERIVGLALLGIELDRLLEGGGRAAQVAGLARG